MIAQVIDITATQSGTIVVVPRTIMITKHAIASMAINMLTGKNACILMALVSHILVSKRSLFSSFISFFVRLNYSSQNLLPSLSIRSRSPSSKARITAVALGRL